MAFYSKLLESFSGKGLVNDWVIIMVCCVRLLDVLHLLPCDRIVEGNAWFLSLSSLFIPCYFNFCFTFLNFLFV